MRLQGSSDGKGKQRSLSTQDFRGGFREASENDMWDKITCEIRQVAQKTIVESIGFGYRGKES